jgi:hypothetical protein
MKTKENLVLRQVADTWIVLPVSSATVNMDGVLNLNESGVLLWKKLEQGAEREELVNILMAEYDVDRETASKDVDEFIQHLQSVNCLDTDD